MYEKRRYALHIYRSVPLGRGKFTTFFYVRSKSGGVIQANVPTVKNTAWRPQLGC